MLCVGRAGRGEKVREEERRGGAVQFRRGRAVFPRRGGLGLTHFGEPQRWKGGARSRLLGPARLQRGENITAGLRQRMSKQRTC